MNVCKCVALRTKLHLAIISTNCKSVVSSPSLSCLLVVHTAQMHISIIHGTEIKFNIGKSVESGQLCGNAIEKVYRKIIEHDDGIVYATENAQQIQWSDNEITEVACISLLILLNWQIVYYFLTSGSLYPRFNDSIIVGIRSIFPIHFKCVWFFPFDSSSFSTANQA